MAHGNKTTHGVGSSDRGVTRSTIAFAYYMRWMPNFVVKVICSDHTRLLKFYLLISAVASMIKSEPDSPIGYLSAQWAELVPFVLLAPVICHIISAIIMILSIRWASKRVETSHLADIASGNAYQITEVLFLSMACMYPLIGAIIYISIFLLYDLRKNFKKHR